MPVRTVTIGSACTAQVLAAGLRDRAAWPSHSADVVAVTDDRDRTHWELAFRGGRAHWTQVDHDQALGTRSDFEQVTGDFTHLRGSWAVDVRGEGSVVRFEFDYATGVAHVAGAVDPVIGRVLVRAACAVVEGIGGPIEILEGGEVLRDGPVPVG